MKECLVIRQDFQIKSELFKNIEENYLQLQ